MENVALLCSTMYVNEFFGIGLAYLYHFYVLLFHYLSGTGF